MTEQNKNYSGRMHLRGIVRLAGEIIAYHYPMRTFVHHNPLHGLETLTFEEAIDEGRRVLGGKGYLPVDLYRKYYHDGRIKDEDIEDALKGSVEDEQITLGSKTIGRLELLKQLMLNSDRAATCEAVKDLPLRKGIDEVMKKLSPLKGNNKSSDIINANVSKDTQSLGKSLTLSDWVDSILIDSGQTTLRETIDAQMIKWCESFLDEGHAKWVMPERDKGFYRAWKANASLEWKSAGIKDSGKKIINLPDNHEDSLMETLTELGVEKENWKEYLMAHLATMPGWVGFIKWREDEADYPWQEAYPATLTHYLAVRLWYEKELVSKICAHELGIGGTVSSIIKFINNHTHSYFLRKERRKACMSAHFSQRADRLILNSSNVGADGKNLRLWASLAEEYGNSVTERHNEIERWSVAWRLLSIAEKLGLKPSDIISLDEKLLSKIVSWMDSFSYKIQYPYWLKALEIGYKKKLLTALKEGSSAKDNTSGRPKAQIIMCIDVRSEPFRRSFESIDNYETLGFAGFFSLFIRFRSLESKHEVDQYPVLMNAKNVIREIPKPNQGEELIKHRHRGKSLKALYTLLYSLKENIVTPYVMVESMGWFYTLPMAGKTLIARKYNDLARWFKKKWVPRIETNLTIDKPTKEEASDILSFNQHVIIKRALLEIFKARGSDASDDFVEFLRISALSEDKEFVPMEDAIITPEEQTSFVEVLKNDYEINRRWASASISRIMRLGLTTAEQVATIGSSLRMMGLTENFGRLVLVCGHGSTSDNNPFEAALDCGACGGNSGHPNSKVFATIANKKEIRDALKEDGLVIPEDTFFIAGKHDTTTDDVVIEEPEDLPSTHIEDLRKLRDDLAEAGRLTSLERCGRFPEIEASLTPQSAKKAVNTRSTDWSQVRPEWGLSGNAAFIIGGRHLTRNANLEGRAFLHSYNHKLDKRLSILEGIMTAPQVVAQWINMEHYFSTVDNTVYGSGSKIYHNVSIKNGVMYGSLSDLRTGLPMQTVMRGTEPYHEPMRLLTVIEAERNKIDEIIAKHPILQNYYDLSWVYLVSIDPIDGKYYEYIAKKGWQEIDSVSI